MYIYSTWLPSIGCRDVPFLLWGLVDDTQRYKHARRLYGAEMHLM